MGYPALSLGNTVYRMGVSAKSNFKFGYLQNLPIIQRWLTWLQLKRHMVLFFFFYNFHINSHCIDIADSHIKRNAVRTPIWVILTMHGHENKQYFVNREDDKDNNKTCCQSI